MLELNFVISRSSIRQMCIDHNWCTGMTNEEYRKILDNPDTLNEKKSSVRESPISRMRLSAHRIITRVQPRPRS